MCHSMFYWRQCDTRHTIGFNDITGNYFILRCTNGFYYPRRRCLFVCMSVFFTRYLKNDSAMITKLNTNMFHHQSWKPIYFGVKRSEVKVTRHKNKSVPVFRWKAIPTFAAYISFAEFFFAADYAADRRFFRTWCFSQQRKHRRCGSQHCCESWLLLRIAVLLKYFK